jgi:hypothetical protein
MAHADCWYWSGTRFAKRYSSISSSRELAAVREDDLDWKGLPR